MSQNPRSKLQSSGADFTPTIHSDTYEYINPLQFDLGGRTIFITGASKGCGRQTAISFARAGASNIAIAARSALAEVQKEIIAAAKEAGRPPPKVLAIQLDVSDEANVQQAATQIKSTFGSVDVLINNAGYGVTSARIGDSDAAGWWRTLEVNLKGPYLVTRAVLPLMIDSPHGLRTILNVSSIGANVISPGMSSYQTSKLALLRLTEFLNLDYKDEGLVAFCIHPGAVLTELGQTLPKEWHKVLVDKPTLTGDATVWLTAERREWLRGRYVSCTWDMEQLLSRREVIEKDDLLKVRLDVGMTEF